MHAHVLSRFTHVQLFAILWTVAPPGSSILGILQAIILEWVATPSSRGSSLSRDQAHVSCIVCCIAGRLFTAEPAGNPLFALHMLLRVYRKTQRDQVEREVGGGIGMGNTCKSMSDSCQCMAKTTTIL